MSWEIFCVQLPSKSGLPGVGTGGGGGRIGPYKFNYKAINIVL